MPCYEPSEPWEGTQQRNAEQAARLLCRHVSATLDAGQMPERDLLSWYIEHREIDRQIAMTPGYHKPNLADERRAEYDIARARRFLGPNVRHKRPAGGRSA